VVEPFFRKYQSADRPSQRRERQSWEFSPIQWLLIWAAAIPIAWMMFVWSVLSPIIALWLVAPPVLLYPFIWAAVKLKWDVEDEWMFVIGLILTALWTSLSPGLGWLNWIM
jgi:hypothetical protein